MAVIFFRKNETCISFKNDPAYKDAVQPIVALTAFEIPDFQEAIYLAKVVSPSLHVGLCEDWDRNTLNDPPYFVN
jgi:hypothetical protein